MFDIKLAATCTTWHSVCGDPKYSTFAGRRLVAFDIFRENSWMRDAACRTRKGQVPVLNASYKLQLTLIAGTKNKEHRMCGIVLPVTLLRRLAPRCDFVLRLLRRTNVLVFVAKTKSTALHAAVETSNVRLLFVRSFSTPARLALLSRGRIYTFAGDYIAIAQPRQISRLPKSLDLCD